MKAMFLAAAMATALTATPSIVFAQDSMAAMPGMSHATPPTDAQGQGVVKAIDTSKGTVTLQHEAITAIHWPAMTMAFKVATPAMLQSVKVGDKVRFTVHPAGMDSTVTSMQSIP
ncbi:MULTISPECIES: copper-binding protein [unclassified Dyella]|uniref:copper-binding protein n=1 Tax=unclassified Dyella TaxID=2634549 RepID=UPI000C846A66|nr:MULTISPECIES: copper-binding protein [unclassified Dyella]MDR3446872.1 copper-binding protein [Dyella sp.]PMQ04097.1 Cation efflux system protein CusF [Dyella sp. AD56]